MKSSSHGFVIASAVAGCAVALGFYLAWGGGSNNDSRPPANPKTPPHSAARGSRDSGGRTPGGASAPAVAARTAAKKPAGHRNAAEPLRVTGQPAMAGGVKLSEADWFARAARVEREANHELQRLTEVLDLNADQRAGVFGVLARNSPSWLPGMQAGGTGSNTGSTVETPAQSGVSEADRVMAYLDADQQQTLIEEEMDRQAWWEEVLPQLLPPALPTTDPTATPVASDPVPDTRAFEGSDTLIE